MKTICKAIALEELADEDWKTQLALKYPNVPKDTTVNVLRENMNNLYGGPWTRIEWNGNFYWVNPMSLKKCTII